MVFITELYIRAFLQTVDTSVKLLIDLLHFYGEDSTE